MRISISEKGQVTIPQRLLEHCGFTPDVEIELVLTDDGLLIRKRNPDLHPVDQIYGILGKGGSTDEYMSEIRGYDYAAEIRRYDHGS
jgi:bifunctional DNA-binding transcriptional regulator/antitoxin component of YhaV-PrlF toxin-antitoxin module